MSTEYCISTNALGLTPLMRTKTTQGADERRETATPIPAPIQLEAVLPLLSRICSTTKAVAGTVSGANHASQKRIPVVGRPAARAAAARLFCPHFE